MGWTLLIGGNRITNCDAALIVEGVEVFRLRDRTHDQQLVADFEVRDAKDTLLAKVAKNNVVFAAKGFTARHGATFSEVLDATGKVVARAEEISAQTIKLSGVFVINGWQVVITDEALQLGGLTIGGNAIEGAGTAIVLSRNQAAIGVARPSS